MLTLIEPAKTAIRLLKKQFHGGIIVNGSSQFELILDATAPKYTGWPTQKLDDNWDRLVGVSLQFLNTLQRSMTANLRSLSQAVTLLFLSTRLKLLPERCHWTETATMLFPTSGIASTVSIT